MDELNGNGKRGLPKLKEILRRQKQDSEDEDCTPDIEFQYEDGTSEIHRIPAEIWRKNNRSVTKVMITDKPVVQFVLDPFLETADIDEENNYFPRKALPSKFQLYKERLEIDT